MTNEVRRSLAQQLLANPLFTEMLDGIERAAIEALVMAGTEQERIEAQWRVRSARSFRRDCQNLSDSTPAPKGAKA